MADMGTDGWCRCLVVLPPLSTLNLLLSLCAGYDRLNTSISAHSLLYPGSNIFYSKVSFRVACQIAKDRKTSLFSRERTLFKIRSYKHLTDDGWKCRNPCKIAIVRSDTQAVNRKCQFFRSSLSVRRYRKAKNYPSPCQYSHSPLKVAREYKIW